MRAIPRSTCSNGDQDRRNAIQSSNTLASLPHVHGALNSMCLHSSQFIKRFLYVHDCVARVASTPGRNQVNLSITIRCLVTLSGLHRLHSTRQQTFPLRLTKIYVCRTALFEWRAHQDGILSISVVQSQATSHLKGLIVTLGLDNKVFLWSNKGGLLGSLGHSVWSTQLITGVNKKVLIFVIYVLLGADENDSSFCVIAVGRRYEDTHPCVSVLFTDLLYFALMTMTCLLWRDCAGLVMNQGHGL